MKSTRMLRLALLIGLALSASMGFAAYQIIAKLVPGTDPKLLAATYGITFLEASPGNRYHLFGATSYLHMEAAEDAMRLNLAQVVWAEDDEEVSVTESTNGKGSGVPQLRKETVQTLFAPGAIYSENTGLLSQIHWNYTPPDNEQRIVRVAILDTGLSPFQPDIWNHVVASKSFNPRETHAWDYRTGPSRGVHPYADVVGHGTMVAGLIYGLAPDAELVIARVCNNLGQSNAWRITKGLAYAMETGAELANLSFGSVLELKAIEYVVEDCSAGGMLCVAPIGNNNQNFALFPSQYSEVLCISGVDHADLKANFSNFSSRADIASPSTGIKSAWWTGQMAIWNGTSFGAPIVTACLAESLKLRTPVMPNSIMDFADQMGDNIDSINSKHVGKLGVRINLELMRSVILGL